MKTRIALLLALAVPLALLLAGPAQAAITVANTNDSGGGSLRQAVEDATPGETINLPAGVYTLTSGPLIVEKALTIAGSGSANTSVRAGGPFNVITVNNASAVTISGLTVRDGAPVGSSVTGAGILSVNTALTLRAVVVTENTANADGAPGVGGGNAQGGGIVSITGRLELIESSVVRNVASAVGGAGAAGGRAEAAGVLAVGPITFVNSTIADNTADARGGQGPTNAGQDGGDAGSSGLLSVQNEPPASSITGSTISGNRADASSGPGGDAGQIEGGGILEVTNAGPVTFTNTTIVGNVARATGSATGEAVGGGVLAVANLPGSLTLLSTTIAYTQVEVPAAGVEGGQILAANNIAFGNTIVASPSPGGSPTQNCFAFGSRSLGFNLDSTDQCGFHVAGDLVNKSEPLLGPLQTNGGSTATLTPAAGSPVVDQGSGFALPTDQRGVHRPIDLPSIPNSAAVGADGSDIGAVELQPSNAFSLGKLTLNKKKGTATLAVTLSQPSAGTLTLAGKNLVTQTVPITGQASLKLAVVPTGKAKVALKRKKGKRKVNKRKVTIGVTYSPPGTPPSSTSRKATLVKKKARKHRKGRHHRAAAL